MTTNTDVVSLFYFFFRQNTGTMDKIRVMNKIIIEFHFFFFAEKSPLSRKIHCRSIFSILIREEMMALLLECEEKGNDE